MCNYDLDVIEFWLNGSCNRYAAGMCLKIKAWRCSVKVLCHIKCCIDTVTVDKRMQVYPNEKPWMTREVWWLLRDKHRFGRESNIWATTGPPGDNILLLPALRWFSQSNAIPHGLQHLHTHWAWGEVHAAGRGPEEDPMAFPVMCWKDSADQLAGVFTRIFHQSLAQSTVPRCLKSSTIVPLSALHISTTTGQSLSPQLW